MPFSEFPKPYTLRKDRQFYMSFAKFPIQPYIGLHRKHIARRPVARSLLAGFCSHHDIEIDVILNPCNKPCSNNLPKIVSICKLNCTKSRQNRKAICNKIYFYNRHKQTNQIYGQSISQYIQ